MKWLWTVWAECLHRKKVATHKSARDRLPKFQQKSHSCLAFTRVEIKRAGGDPLPVLPIMRTWCVTYKATRGLGPTLFLIFLLQLFQYISHYFACCKPLGPWTRSLASKPSARLCSKAASEYLMTLLSWNPWSLWGRQWTRMTRMTSWWDMVSACFRPALRCTCCFELQLAPGATLPDHVSSIFCQLHDVELSESLCHPQSLRTLAASAPACGEVKPFRTSCRHRG